LATLHHNITTVLTQDLLTAGDNVNDVKHMSIANVHATNSAQVNLILNKGDKNYYLIRNFKLTAASTLVLGVEDGIRIDNTLNGFSLRVQVDDGSTGASPVDVIITRG
tara:strand:+ start:374 stop:697 length:324 start_codon:yes stop_codon:yes gene_type:complete